MMFYSDEDLDFYEHEIDLTALKKRQEEQAKKEEQERERLQEEQRKKEARQTRRRTWARRLTGLAAALAVSVTSVASYDWLVAKPRIEELETQRDEMQTQLQELSGSASVSGISSVVYGNELTVPQIIAKARPSVVAISTVSGWSTGTGSGVIMTEDGTIMTNAHVVSGAQSITVRVMDGTEYEATLLGMDEKTDLAVIKIDATGLTPAEFGDSSSIVQGEIAVAIGNPLGLAFEGSVTQGIISAVSREIEVDGRTMTYIQTDAAINPGNSGGALINKYGQVVGITSAKLSSSAFSDTSIEGMGFAIPMNTAKEIVDELIANGYIAGRPSLGITGRNLTAQEAMSANVPQGVYVYSVDERANAANEGLLAGDIITAVEGNEITTMDEINAVKEEMQAGDKLDITVYRMSAGKFIDLTITLTDQHDLSDDSTSTQSGSDSSQGQGENGYSQYDQNPFYYFFGR